MTSADDLALHLATFFSEYLPGRTGASRHTVLAYRDAWKLWLRFAAAKIGRSVVDLRVTDLDVDTALAFLDSLETDRHNAVVTRNHRRTALQSFFRYLGSAAPEYVAHCRRILAIPRKRAPHPSAMPKLISRRNAVHLTRSHRSENPVDDMPRRGRKSRSWRGWSTCRVRRYVASTHPEPTVFGMIRRKQLPHGTFRRTHHRTGSTSCAT
jgi:site-specific recombinase XerD